MIGTKLANRFEIVRELGRGGMGVVYLARDPLLERDVAIKLVSPHLLTPEAVERFKREAKVVARMDHPGIVAVHDIGEHEGCLFFVMPYVPGVSLRSLIDSRALNLGDMLDITAQVAEALEYSHGMSVIHRDVKPENILVVRQESGGLRARVTDFGLARTAADHHITTSGSFVGTIAYLSPEQVAAREVDGRSDVYSLGVILYEGLAGHPPFTGEIHSVLFRIVSEIPRSLREAGADVDEDLEAYVLRCLEKDPTLRPQKARDMAEALRQFGQSLRESERGRVLYAATDKGGGHRAFVPSFVGREKEFGELQQRLSMAVAGECQFVMISGEPGVGKSRLLDELEKFARARDMRILHGRFVEQETALPYQAFCEVIQEYLHRTPSTRTSSPADFSDLATDLVTLFPVLAEEFSVGAKPAGPGETAPKAHDRTYIFDLLARSFLRIGGGKPMVVLLEDLHYGDVSLEALQYIVRRLGPTPALVVATFRSTEVDRHHPLARMLSGFQGDRRFTQLQLAPFSASEHRMYLRSLIGSDDLEKDTVQKLFEATEGNPHFTRELVRSLVDSGRIAKRETGSWSLSGEGVISSESLPPTIQQAVEKRIERLPDEWVEMLSLAAILGRTFDFRDFESLAEGHDVESLVDHLIDAGFLEEERGTRSDQLIFSSGVVRDVLYARVPRRRRRSLHRKYAEMLEKRYEGRLERIYPQLVHHFAEGDVAEKVIEYGIAFAEKSLAAFSADEAIRAGKTVLEFLMEEGTASPLLGKLRMILAEAYRLNSDFDEAVKESEAAIRIFERGGQPDRIILAVVAAAEIAWEGRRVDTARRLLEKGLDLAGQDIPSRIRLLSLGATVANLRGEYERASQYLRELQRIRPEATPVDADLPRGGTLSIPLSIPLVLRHPAAFRSVEEGEVMANVYQNLLSTDDQGFLVPELCSFWEESEMGRTFTFTLRPNIRLHDGRPLTAALVKQAFEKGMEAARTRLGPAYSAILGTGDFLAGKTTHVEGIEANSEDQLVIHLKDPLPIYPALLTDPGAAVALDSVGTGPFRIEHFSTEKVKLARNDDYWGRPALLDSIEFHCGVNSADVSAGFRTSRFDVAGNLPPRDLEQMLQDRRLKAGLVESIRKSIYFIVFHNKGPMAKIPEVRQAMSGVVRATDLVRATLGRLAEPAEGLLPPGILGHDPGRRRAVLLREKAVELLATTGEHPPLQLKAAVHPIFQDRYEVFLSALFKVWSGLGIHVSIETSTMQEYLDAEIHNQQMDLIIGRWIADYDDPDSFLSSMFRTPAGIMSHYYSSSDLDLMIDRARFEGDPREREKMYRTVEDKLAQSGCFVPLFHEIDYRIFHQRIRSLKLSNRPPFLNYGAIAKTESSETTQKKTGGGTLIIPTTGDIPTLDPSHTITAWQQEVNPTIFETLTRTGEGANIVPWLAAEFHSERGGRSYWFRLRDSIRFHDGRRLTARDVRYSFEHLLSSDNEVTNWLLSPIEGASEILFGTSRDLKGFHILSPLEFRIDLEQPVAFFPSLLAFTPASIIPEGSEFFEGSWRDGCIGTGPFRVLRFEAGNRIELEPNPYYWQDGVPRADALQFMLKVLPSETIAGFRSGRFSLAWNLLPADAELLRMEPDFASGYHATPSLSTYMMVFNVHRGPFADPLVRQRVAHGLDVDQLVRRQAGRLAVPATGIIPPGLLGYDPTRLRQHGSGSHKRAGDPIEIKILLHSIYETTYQPLAHELLENLKQIGFKPVIVEKRSEYAPISQYAETADLNLTRWIADYPDSDAFAYSLVHSQKGLHGPFCGLPELDRLIERGRVESDPGTRHEIYRQFEEMVGRSYLMLPLFHEQTYRFTNPGMEGFEFRHNYPTVAYEKLWLRT